ncbi:MAG: hypothetical protein ACLRVU_08395 [Beduini sp.]|uniref:hypothetical protein n=1 Tax=Beduini sp. TaxID=1922300 RepID=UPI0039A352B9
MKKTMIIAAVALLLSGCTSNKTTITSKVTGGDNIAVKTENGIELTKQKIYESLLSTYGANKVVNEALLIAANIEVTDTEAINNKVNETIKSYTDMLGGEDKLLEYVKSNGFDSIDSYKAEMIEPSVKQTLMIQKYIEENFDTLAEKYGYAYIRYFSVDNESDAISYISKIDNGEMTFEDAANEATGSVPDKKLTYTKASTSTVDSSIAKMSTSFTTDGMYSVPVALSDGKYAVINVMDTDRQANKDAIVTSLLAITDVTSEAEAHYLKAYQFEVFEKGLAEDIKGINENYLK